MRKNYILNICIVLLILAGSTGCSEKNDPQPAVYSKLLTGETSKTWKLTSFLIIERGKAVDTYSASQFDCDGDNLYVFYAGIEKRIQVLEGTSKCAVSNSDIAVEDTWSLVNANATLSFIITLPFLPDFPLPYIIKSLTANQLTVEIYFEDEDDASYRFIFSSVSK